MPKHSPRPRCIVFAVYEGVSLLDLAGPLEAFRVTSAFAAPERRVTYVKARRIVLRASGLDPLAVYVVAKQRFHDRLLPFVLRERRTRFALDSDECLLDFQIGASLATGFPVVSLRRCGPERRKLINDSSNGLFN